LQYRMIYIMSLWIIYKKQSYDILTLSLATLA